MAFSPLEGLAVSGSIWASYGISNQDTDAANDSNEWDEIDYTVALDYTLSETIALSLGHIFYHFPPVGDSDANDTKEIYAGVSVGLPYNLSTGLTLYYDYDNGKGVYTSWGVDYERGLSDAVSAFSGFSLGYMVYTEDAEDGGFYVDSDGDALSTFSDSNLSLGLSVDVGYGLSLTNAIIWTHAFNSAINDTDAGRNEYWGLITLAYEL